MVHRERALCLARCALLREVIELGLSAASLLTTPHHIGAPRDGAPYARFSWTGASCGFTYVTCVGAELHTRVVVCPSAAFSCVSLYGCTFPAVFSYSGYCEIKYHPKNQTFQHPPSPPSPKLKWNRHNHANTRAMKSTIHARRHGLRKRWSTLDLGGQGEANKLIVRGWYFISH